MPDTAPPRRALAISAHPDDLEFGCAGTVAAWVDGGWDVRYVIATSGQRGVQDPRADADALGRFREDEAREAARICGVHDVTFLGLMDAAVQYGPELLRALSREFRRHQPTRLLVMDARPLPTDAFINHPDHRVVGQAALDVTITGGTTAAIHPELLLEEGLEPWQGLDEVWVFGPAGGPVAVDITATFERKMRALEAHRSQTEGFDVRAFLGPRLAELGRPHGYDYAEAFTVLDVRWRQPGAQAPAE